MQVNITHCLHSEFSRLLHVEITYLKRVCYYCCVSLYILAFLFFSSNNVNLPQYMYLNKRVLIMASGCNLPAFKVFGLRQHRLCPKYTSAMAWYYNAVSSGVVSMQYQAISSTCMFYVHIQIVENVWNLCIVYVFLCVCSCQYPFSTNIPYFISLYADEKIITITHPRTRVHIAM